MLGCRAVRRVPLFVFALLVLAGTWRALSADFWDDALFFQRIASNLLHHHVAAWNVSDGPVHGSTSQLFQFVAAFVLAVAPGWYQLATKVLLGGCLFATALFCARFVVRRTGAAGVVVLVCGLCAPPFLALIASGMETLLALAVLSAFFAFLPASGSRWLGPFVGVGVAAVWAARPDLLLLLPLPCAALLWERGLPLQRQRGLLIGGLWGAAGLGLLLALFWWGYGAAFPLSFHLKTHWLSSYDAAYRALSQEGERRELLTFCLLLLPFALLGLFRADALGRALLASALLFLAYHQLSTVAVMGYHARFQLPAAVPVLLAAGLGWPRFLTWAGARVAAGGLLLLWLPFFALAWQRGWIERTEVDFYLGWLTAPQYLAFVVPTAVLFGLVVVNASWRAWWVVPVAALFASLVGGFQLPPDQRDAAGLTRIASRMWALTGLYEVKRCLPEPLHLYHSELGVTGVLFADSKLTDLSGLMNPKLVFERPAFDSYCLADLPDVLFLPHRTHVRFNQEIAASECLKRYVHPERIQGSSSTLYLRADRLAEFERCPPR